MQAAHKTFKVKKILAKKARQNRQIPQWIRLRTDNTIRCGFCFMFVYHVPLRQTLRGFLGELGREASRDVISGGGHKPSHKHMGWRETGKARWRIKVWSWGNRRVMGGKQRRESTPEAVKVVGHNKI